MTKKRIWELDALRGICIIGMIIVHLFYDLSAFGGLHIMLPDWFLLIRQYGHILFVLISGICATLAASTFKRGAVVFAAGLLVSYVTIFMDYILGINSLRIWFGILHMLGVCMMLYPIFKKLPFWALALFGAAFLILGYWMETVQVPVDYLFPIGLRSGRIYTGSDFFPILPGFGWFLIGASVGKAAYKNKESLLPKVNEDFILLRFFRYIGRHSLLIYLLHQPILTAIVLVLFT